MSAASLLLPTPPGTNADKFGGFGDGIVVRDGGATTAWDSMLVGAKKINARVARVARQKAYFTAFLRFVRKFIGVPPCFQFFCRALDLAPARAYTRLYVSLTLLSRYYRRALRKLPFELKR